MTTEVSVEVIVAKIWDVSAFFLIVRLPKKQKRP